MNQSRLIYHAIIYATDPCHFLTPVFDEPIFNCIEDLIRNSGNRVVAVGGSAEHIHILLETNPITSIGDLIENIRLQATRWVQQHPAAPSAANPELGVGCFTVSYSMMDRVQRFISSQDIHHQSVSFEDEFMCLLDKHQIRYQECDLWCKN